VRFLHLLSIYWFVLKEKTFTKAIVIIIAALCYDLPCPLKQPPVFEIPPFYKMHFRSCTRRGEIGPDMIFTYLLLPTANDHSSTFKRVRNWVTSDIHRAGTNFAVMTVEEDNLIY